MSRGTSMNMIHLLERIHEPLGFGLRGGGGGQGDPMIYYYYKDQNMMDSMIESDAMKDTVTQIRSRMEKEKNSGRNVMLEPLPDRPKMMPDLLKLNRLCPKNANFCYFFPNHRQAFSILKQVFMAQPNVEEVYKMACACRDNALMNPGLFVHAFCSCLVSRKDTLHIQVPTHVEIFPDNYCGSDVVRQANKMAHMPDMPPSRNAKQNGEMAGMTTPPILIDQNVTGSGNDPEQRMWYFREDILVNSHHNHWHVVFPGCTPKDPNAPGYRDRRGELFYYMHHSMIARYDTERLCNGLPRARKIDFVDLTVNEGYFSKLSSENSGTRWGTRQAGTKITDVRTPSFHIRVEDVIRYRERILESIDLGYYVQKDSETGKESRQVLDPKTGIDILGNIVENSQSLSPHLQYYGEFGFHNMGHVLIACSNDPRGKFREELGVMGDVSTAMRDPAFYRWHKYIDHMFDLYKMTLPPYPLKSKDKNELPLTWDGISVVRGSFYVKARDGPDRNILRTFWDYKDVNLARGLDFRRNVNEGVAPKPVVGRFTHLNHGAFDYFLKIENNTGRPVKGTVRIFMAPRFDENGKEFPLSEQRLLFFEMDKVSKQLQPGVNDIRIASSDSSVTLRDENGSSFKNIEKVHKELKDRPDAVRQSQCSCGWPQHLLIPRGSGGGTQYDLFVLVTDGQIDQVPNVDRTRECNSALSFCGVLREKYPDSRPMGYPFDRKPYTVDAAENNNFADPCPADKVPVGRLEDYVLDVKNSGNAVVTIIHDNMMKKGQSEMEQQVIRPDGKCIQMKDFYNKDSKGTGGGGGGGWNNNGGGSSGGNWGQQSQQQQRPPNPNYQLQQPQQNQWGGPRGGRNYGNRGRNGRDGYDNEPVDVDEDWEELGGREY